MKVSYDKIVILQNLPFPCRVVSKIGIIKTRNVKSILRFIRLLDN